MKLKILLIFIAQIPVYALSATYSSSNTVSIVNSGVPIAFKIKEQKNNTVNDLALVVPTERPISLDMNTKQLIPVKHTSKKFVWTEVYPKQPSASSLKQIKLYPIKNIAIPVYYKGSKRVMHRIIVSDKNTIYFTSVYGSGNKNSIFFPKKGFSFLLKNQKGTVNSDGYMLYEKGNEEVALNNGYLIEGKIDKIIGKAVIAPDFRWNGVYSLNFSGSNGANGSNGRSGASYTPFIQGPYVNGRNGGDGWNGQAGNAGEDGAIVSVVFEAAKSRFYERPLKRMKVVSSNGTGVYGHIFLESQSTTIISSGGNGGIGGDGGNGGNGERGHQGATGYSGRDASKYSEATNGGPGGSGGDGGDGGDGGNGGKGGNGGNGGQIFVRILQGDANFNYLVKNSFEANVSPGSGGVYGDSGRGGIGGGPGPGGLGGRGGNSYQGSDCYYDSYTQSNVCTPIYRSGGYNGPSGFSGTSGNNGTSGVSGSYGYLGSRGSIKVSYH
ncbi:hypothetical protein [Vibrio neonatus]|uniref:hypothetical protein n=1 Tax=Vibrio neonatus TaxID=278860 RepID=UPI0021C3489C|nr:hypothetical protein [Vibrio neonatus]